VLAAPAFAVAGDFLPAPTSPEAAGSNPFSIAVGDFNRDGKQDQAIANQSSDNVTILLGDGSGNFTGAATSPEAAGDGPVSVAVGDFDANGKDDLAVANRFSNNVTILLGDGSGNFSAAATSPEAAGTSPLSVAVGDFDANGTDDLAVGNASSNNVTILLGDGSGDFSAAATSPEAAGDSPVSVAVGDFNGDGKQDQAVANQSSDNVTILLGDGSGNFTTAATSPEAAGGVPGSVAVGDFDRNGKDDLAVANRFSNNVTILLGDGSGNFTTAATSPEAAGHVPSSVAVGDFDANGKDDLAVANQPFDNVTILLGDGSGDFTAAATSPEAAGAGPVSVAVGDFDRNGKDDLAVANRFSNDVTILLGGAHGLDLTTAGTGSGFVDSSPAGIDCGRNIAGHADCTESYADATPVTLTAHPSANTDFAGFTGGGCSTSPCTVTLDADKSVDAAFTLKQRTLTVSRSGTGGGTVTGTGIDCGGAGHTDCTETVADGTQITLTATAAANSDFAGFTGGGCSTSPCTVTLDADKSVDAAFTLKRHSLAVVRSGEGSGSVSSSPAGIDCPSDCDEAFDEGSSVTLTADPDPGSGFAGFSGAGCAGDTTTCTITVGSGDAVIDVHFTDKAPPETEITRVPVNPRPERTHFNFRSSEPGSTFECQLDEGAPKPCDSPVVYRRLTRSRHTFSVFAIDRFGNADTSAATASFRVRRARGH
jgi:hypothetical protein